MENLNLYIILRDTKNKNSDYKLTWKILNSPLSKEWVSLFIKNFIFSNHPIEKDYCLKGWVDSWDSEYSRNLQYLCDSMNKSISRVNRYMVPLGYDYIDLDFSVEKLKSSEYQNLMNDIHHHFELLVGQVWRPSKWIGMADDQTKTAIRLLNNLCHEIEDAVKSINQHERLKRSPDYRVKHSSMHIHASLMGKNFEGRPFEKKIRKELTLEHYNSFSNFRKWGDIVLYYSQLGKRHIEAFYDRDEKIDKTNISGYRYVTGEFVISFVGSVLGITETEPPEFFEWLDRHGFDKNDPTLGLGYPRLAELILKDHPLKIIKELKLRDDLFEVGLEDSLGEIIYSKKYDFVWQDLDQTKEFD